MPNFFEVTSSTEITSDGKAFQWREICMYVCVWEGGRGERAYVSGKQHIAMNSLKRLCSSVSVRMHYACYAFYLKFPQPNIHISCFPCLGDCLLHTADCIASHWLSSCFWKCTEEAFSILCKTLNSQFHWNSIMEPSHKKNYFWTPWKFQINL